MSHPAICAAVTGWPRFGVSTVVAPAQPPTTSDTSTHARSRVDMLHLAVRLDGPGVDRVVVEDGVGTVLGDEAVALRLDRARVVRRAGLQHGRAAVPLPGHAEERDRPRPHRRGPRWRPPPLCTGGLTLPP